MPGQAHDNGYRLTSILHGCNRRSSEVIQPLSSMKCDRSVFVANGGPGQFDVPP